MRKDYSMKTSSAKDWVIDSLILVFLTGITVFFLPLVSAWFAGLRSIAIAHWLPHAIVGFLLGLAAALLIRHRKIILALLPAVLVCLFNFLYLSFGSDKYPWGRSREDYIIVTGWLILVAAALLCGQIVLKRRRLNI